jgi:hypothetical protein
MEILREKIDDTKIEVRFTPETPSPDIQIVSLDELNRQRTVLLNRKSTYESEVAIRLSKFASDLKVIDDSIAFAKAQGVKTEAELAKE